MPNTALPVISNGIFSEEELNALGIFCGVNVPQTACDVYTSGSTITSAFMTIDFADNDVGNNIAGFLCWSIAQDCVSANPVGLPYQARFTYSRFIDAPMYWNRYAINQNTGVVSTLFISHWELATFNGQTVAKETFPLQGGNLGYASVYLMPDTVNNSIVWNTVGMEYSPQLTVDITFSTPNLITIQTQENQFPGFFHSTGVFQAGRNVLGTINIWGTFGAVP